MSTGTDFKMIPGRDELATVERDLETFRSRGGCHDTQRRQLRFQLLEVLSRERGSFGSRALGAFEDVAEEDDRRRELTERLLA